MFCCKYFVYHAYGPPAMGYWHQRANERHGNPPQVNQLVISGQTHKVGRPQVSWGKQVQGM